MHFIAMELDRLFLEEGHRVVNGLDIDYSQDKSVQVCSKVPGLAARKDDICELISEHNSIYDFIYEYVITTLDDLNRITPALMLKRFMTGRCRLICSIDPGMEVFLSYVWRGPRLIAEDPDSKLHEVPQYIKTKEEIVVYTRHYYEKLLA